MENINSHDKYYSEILQDLFSIISPEQLRKTIFKVFMNYLIHLDNRNYPEDLTMIAEDIYLLMQFLEDIEKGRAVDLEEELSGI